MDNNSMYAVASALTEKEVIILDMPPQDIIVEAKELQNHIERDRTQLLQYGLTESYLDNFDPLLELFTTYAHMHETESNDIKNAQNEWTDGKKKIRAIKKKIDESLSFVFRKNRTVTKILTDIRSSRSDERLLTDLEKYYKIGMNHLEDIGQVDLTEEDLAMLMDTHEHYTPIYQKAKIEVWKTETYIFLRKVYTLLKESIDEIRQVGLFVYRNDKEEQKRYRSNYYLQRGRKISRTKQRKKTT